MAANRICLEPRAKEEALDMTANIAFAPLSWVGEAHMQSLGVRLAGSKCGR